MINIIIKLKGDTYETVWDFLFSRRLHLFTVPGSRGYRKNNAYDRSLRVSKHRARQQAKREIRSAVFSIDN